VLILGAVLFSAGCGTDSGMKKGPRGGTIDFEGIPVPITDGAKRKVVASPSVTINGTSHRIGYNVLMRSGDVIGGNTFGLILDQDGMAVTEKDGSRFVSNDNDFSSLIPVGGKLFNITHFESRPGAMYLTELSQDRATGRLTPVGTRSIDFSQWGGLWVPCAGSVTPWNSHLGSEEYPPNARAVEAAKSPDKISDYYKPMLRYFGVRDPFNPSVDIQTIQSTFHPYRYGYPVEVFVGADGSTRVEKRLAMGRLAVELAYVMPDRRTAYISDDGENVGLFLFVADTPGDLGAGRLWAARWTQRAADNGGRADIDWIDLGHAAQSEIRAAIERGIRFSEIFETADPKQPLPPGFTAINAYDGDGAAIEFLRLKPGMEKIASRLETRRYAAILGATVELRKEEGIAYDPVENILYVAMSEIARGMEDYGKSGKPSEAYDKGGPNHVRLPYNDAGCVYGLRLRADARVGSDYVAHDMFGVLCGEMKKYPADSPYARNTADVDKIANPDNLTFLPGYKTLIIGEDTGSGHQNDAVWAYNVETRALTRIQTTPYGAETTSPYFYPDINGWSYIMSVVQHPYGESDEDKLADPSDARAYVGYIGPMPALP
jgi:secreted PhoX family phosphatase